MVGERMAIKKELKINVDTSSAQRSAECTAVAASEALDFCDIV